MRGEEMGPDMREVTLHTIYITTPGFNKGRGRDDGMMGGDGIVGEGIDGRRGDGS